MHVAPSGAEGRKRKPDQPAGGCTCPVTAAAVELTRTAVEPTHTVTGFEALASAMYMPPEEFCMVLAGHIMSIAGGEPVVKPSMPVADLSLDACSDLWGMDGDTISSTMLGPGTAVRAGTDTGTCTDTGMSLQGQLDQGTGMFLDGWDMAGGLWDDDGMHGVQLGTSK